MISKECFVYIQLPGTLNTVTAGKFRWERSGSKTEIGSFVYGRSYLTNPAAIPIDPFELPLREKVFQNVLNEGVHGPLRDAAPDSWGRYIIQKYTPPSEHDPMGYLLNSAADRIGALSFGYGKTPPAPERSFNQTEDLEKIIAAANKLERDGRLTKAEKLLLMVGPSAGGARPKTTVRYENELWIAKFPGANDRQNYPKLEFATMKLAKACGLNVPEVRIIKVGTVCSQA